MTDVSKTSSNPRNNVVNYDYSDFEMNNYTFKPLTFSGDSTKFEWWKSKMYTHTIDVDDELWYIIKDGIDVPIDGVRMVADRKSLTPSQKKIYRKYHRVRFILVDSLPHSEYLKIIKKSTAKTIFESLVTTYEGNYYVKKEKAKLWSNSMNYSE